MKNSERLNGKSAVVTGAANGIGRAIAERFAREGAKVVVTDVSPEVERVAEQINREGGCARAVLADITQESGVEQIMDTCMRDFGGLHVVVANAGIRGGQKSIMELTERQWLAVLKVNVISAALCIKHAASRMAAQGGGSIVCTASIAGLRAGSGTAAYSASKAAVISMTQVSACELGGTGIRVNALCPGAVKTQMLDFVLDETESFCKSNAPIARMGRADEVAGAALFLASDESAYITGQILVVDGGLTAGLRGNWGHLGATSQPAKATSD